MLKGWPSQLPLGSISAQQLEHGISLVRQLLHVLQLRQLYSLHWILAARVVRHCSVPLQLSERQDKESDKQGGSVPGTGNWYIGTAI